VLTDRQAAILDFIIGEYVANATPVPSSSIAQKRVLKVSPATIRNEMAELEEEGYITRRHVSGGGIPSDKGYRFHVESFTSQPALSEEEEQAIRARFLEVSKDVETGTKLLAELLSMLVKNVAVATSPKALQTRIRRVDLVALQEALALVVLVLQEARTRQRLVPIPAALKQDDLTHMSNKLTAVFGGATKDALSSPRLDLGPVERQVLGVASEILEEEDARRFEEPHVSGLRHLLHQPEFSQGGKMRDLLEVLDDKAFLKDALPHLMRGEQFRAVIGEENVRDAMHECSIILSRYGSSDGIGGIIAVIGPTRMEYKKAIGSLRLLSDLMSDVVGQIR
jgi:heat-inducible transcriptional repressor